MSTGWMRSRVRRTTRTHGGGRSDISRPRSCSSSARWRAAPDLDVSDAEAPIVAGICRKLDGVALAIELAARRVESYGLQQTAALLDQRLTLLWQGRARRRRARRHCRRRWTGATGFCPNSNALVLRRLAVFVGHFTLDAALEVVTSATLDRSTVFGAIDSLVAKSMVATARSGR